jgi:hypothetical protein
MGHERLLLLFNALGLGSSYLLGSAPSSLPTVLQSLVVVVWSLDRRRQRAFSSVFLFRAVLELCVQNGLLYTELSKPVNSTSVGASMSVRQTKRERSVLDLRPEDVWAWSDLPSYLLFETFFFVLLMFVSGLFSYELPFAGFLVLLPSLFAQAPPKEARKLPLLFLAMASAALESGAYFFLAQPLPFVILPVLRFSGPLLASLQLIKSRRKM